MAHASTQSSAYPQGHEELFSSRQKIRATDFTTAREIWREGVTILKAIKLPSTRSGFSLLLMHRSEACLAKSSERSRIRARINPVWPLVFILLFLFVLISLRAAETVKTSDCMDCHGSIEDLIQASKS